MIKHKVTRKVFCNRDNRDISRILTHFIYRGVTFDRDDNRRGHWDHYRTISPHCDILSETRKSMLIKIDSMLDKPTGLV